jgi:serine/threonine protein kinase
MQAGQQLHHYRLIEKIGEGGMGVVWKAEDTRLHRQVALKLVPETKQDGTTVDRHLREARAASALNHPNICVLHDIGEWEGRRFIVMELLEGRSLQDRIGGRPLDIDMAVDLAIQISDALAAAHAKGIVHRDVKPANIMVIESGSTPYAKILDFGLAKLGSNPLETDSTQAETRTQLDVTRPGEVLGTLSYMSPEQALAKPVDHRTDIFSLGMVLYEMLTGHRAFEGSTAAGVFDAILNREPVAPVEHNAAVPNELERVVKKALEKSPALRYQSAADLTADLHRLRRGSTTSGPEVPAVVQGGRRGILALVAVAALVFIVGVVWQIRRVSTTVSTPAPTDSTPTIAGPSIAVLPFVNASGDPDQRYFSDGLTDDIVTELSRYGELSVIACKSGPCEGDQVDVREIGESLDVRYVLQGRVQSTPQNIRVSFQLSSGGDGRLVWGDKYERKMTARDLFDLQDDLTRQVVSAIAGSTGALARAELPGARRKPPANLDSYDCILRVYQYLKHHFPENHLAARECLERVVEAEPDYVDGLAWLSYLYTEQFHHRWNEPEGEYDSRARALEFAERAVRLDDGNQLAHAYLGLALVYVGDGERGIIEMRRAVDLHPNNAHLLTMMSNKLASQGDFEHAVPMARKAIALTPNPPEYIDLALFLDHYFHGRYAEALALSRGGVIGGPDFREPLFLAATYGQLGRLEEARPVLDELRTLWTRPTNELRIELIERHLFSPDVADRLIEGAAKAGLEGL